MVLFERLNVISEKHSAAAEAARKPEAPKKNYFDSLPTELRLAIVRHLPHSSLPTICRLNKHWCSVGTDELLRQLIPVRCGANIGKEGGEDDGVDTEMDWALTQSPSNAYRSILRDQAIRHFINTNNVDALRHFLGFMAAHLCFSPRATSLLRDEPASLRARVTKDEEERFCLSSPRPFVPCAVAAAFKYNDMSCTQLLIDHGLASYDALLVRAVFELFPNSERFARPPPGPDSRGGHNSVLDWLLAYPPRHVVQAMLVMWGQQPLHIRLLPLCDWRSHSHDNMLILAAAQGHPASLQVVDDLRMMVEILTDGATGAVIPEARQSLSRALRIARGMSSMWPDSPPLVAEYLQSVCPWEGQSSSSSSSSSSSTDNTNNPPPPPAPPLILPPQDPVLHRLIDLKTYDEMLEPENWLELGRAVPRHYPLPWLVSTEFLSDEEAARRMRCFERSLRGLRLKSPATQVLLSGASAFRRWRCVEVLLDALRKNFPGKIPQLVLCRAIFDAVHGEPGFADGRIIRKLIHAGVRDWAGSSYNVAQGRMAEGAGNGVPSEGRGFSWEHFRLAFVERQQDREQRETPACREMREAFLRCMTLSDLTYAPNFLVDEPSKALYRASLRRLLQREIDELGGGGSAGVGGR